MQLVTERLILRPFNEQDLPDFARLNQDPQVMRYYPRPYTEAESAKLINLCTQRWQDDGFSFSAVELRKTGAFVGLCGLSWFDGDVDFAPAVEIGWRILPEFWRQGLASEAARAWLDFGFQVKQLDEIVSFTATINTPSEAVMQRIGMQRYPAFDFAHPNIEAGHVLCDHIVYRLTRAQYLKAGFG